MGKEAGSTKQVRRRSYKHGRGRQLRFELTHLQRFGDEDADGPSAYDRMIEAGRELGLSPVRQGTYTVVFRCTLAESRQLTERAAEAGLVPQLERGKVISFRATVEEHALLSEAGKRVGLSATGFAAIAALEGAQFELKRRRRRRRVKDFEALRQMVVEMQLATNQVSRAGNLLNQAVKRLHAEGTPSPDLEKAARGVVDQVDEQDRLVHELGKLLREVMG